MNRLYSFIFMISCALSAKNQQTTKITVTDVNGNISTISYQEHNNVIVNGIVYSSGNPTVIPHTADGHELTKKEYSLENVSRVTATSIGNVEITQGNEETLTVEASKNIMPYVKPEISGSEVTLKIDGTIMVMDPVHLKYIVQLKKLEELRASGTGNVSLENISGNNLTIDSSGTKNISAKNLNIQNLSIDRSGTGNITLKGFYKRIYAELSGTGNFDNSQATAADFMQIHKSGTGNAYVNAKKIVGSNSGTGNLAYQGASEVDVSNSGLGKVYRTK